MQYFSVGDRHETGLQAGRQDAKDSSHLRCLAQNVEALGIACRGVCVHADNHIPQGLLQNLPAQRLNAGLCSAVLIHAPAVTLNPQSKAGSFTKKQTQMQQSSPRKKFNEHAVPALQSNRGFPAFP
jgi:hypothetical protein